MSTALLFRGFSSILYGRFGTTIPLTAPTLPKSFIRAMYFINKMTQRQKSTNSKDFKHLAALKMSTSAGLKSPSSGEENVEMLMTGIGKPGSVFELPQTISNNSPTSLSTRLLRSGEIKRLLVRYDYIDYTQLKNDLER